MPTGLAVAELLNRDGNEVIVAIGSVALGETLHQYQRNVYAARLYRAGVRVEHHLELAGAEEGQVRFRNLFAPDLETRIEAGLLVLALGRVPEHGLAEAARSSRARGVRGRRLPEPAKHRGGDPRGHAGRPAGGSGDRSRFVQPVELGPPVPEHVVALVPSLVSGECEVAVGNDHARPSVLRRPDEDPAPFVADDASADPLDAALVSAAVADGDEHVVQVRRSPWRASPRWACSPSGRGWPGKFAGRTTMSAPRERRARERPRGS